MTATTVRLYGEMGRMFGRTHRFHLDSNTPREAVSALLANFPKLEAYLMHAKDRGIGFAVFREKKNIKEEELETDIGNGEIRIAPMIFGAKGGIFQIILGAVLVVAGAYFHIPVLINAGIGLIAGGVVQMLTQTPKGLNNKEAAANQANDVFSGAVNTQAQGNPVPDLLGEMIVGSAVISAGIQAEDVIATQGPASTSDGGMGGGGRTIAINAQ